MPYVTLTHHLLAYNSKENETVTYNVDEFAESLVTAFDVAMKRDAAAEGGDAGGGSGDTEAADTGDRLAAVLDDKPITVSSYVGLPSVIFNQSKLGYYLVRGGYNF